MNEPKIFLIGDCHFGHRNIIKYCNRPFANVEEMTESLIKNWNSVVGKSDIVYVVGDFALCGKQKIIETGKRLNGRKRLIIGNHDQASVNTYREAGFEFVYNHSIVLDDFYIVSHIPMVGISENTPFVNIFAHVHDDPTYKDCSCRSFCVSAERINYTPIWFEDIKALIKAQEVYMANRVTSEDILRMNEIYYKTHVFAEVARQTGFSASTVRKYVDVNWKPVASEEIVIFNMNDIPDFKEAVKCFRGVDNYGDLCVLTEQECEEIRELWKELTV